MELSRVGRLMSRTLSGIRMSQVRFEILLRDFSGSDNEKATA